jgi:Flp pilus assembly protein TadG
MNRNKAKKIHMIPAFRRNEQGSSLIELAMVAPVLAFLVFSSFRLCIQLKGTQIADSMSRELTSVAYRECIADQTAVGSSKFDPQLCLDSTIQYFEGQSEHLAPSARFVVTLYTYDPGTDEVTMVSTAASDGQVSRVSVATFTDNDAFGKAMRNSIHELRRLMVGEVFYRENGSEVYASTVI